MTSTSQKIVFFGTEDISVPSLQALLDNQAELGIKIALVVTKPDAPKGRSRQAHAPAVKTLARARGIRVLQPLKLTDIASELSALQATTGVLVSYGKIIPESIISLFPRGIINVHPSRLPQYRGPSPIEAAVLHGDRETAVSIMSLVKAMDAGPVYAAFSYLLDGTETKEYLYTALGNFGATKLVQTLPSILDGSLEATPQDETQATYCQLIQRSDGIINWGKPAEQLEREIRAYAGWPGSRTTLGDIEVIITAARVLESGAATPGTLSITDDSLAVATSTHLLAIDALKPLGKKEMPVRAFLAGYRDRLVV